LRAGAVGGGGGAANAGSAHGVSHGGGFSDYVAANPKKYYPVVYLWREVSRLLGAIKGVYRLMALERKFRRAGVSWEWFWLFPMVHLSLDPLAA